MRVPRDREVVVYCACPNEATAAKVALQLRAQGFRRVRPLGGGIDAWSRPASASSESRTGGFPLWYCKHEG